MPATLHVLRVFCDDEDAHGNALGVFVNGSEVATDDRQRVAARLGFSETVFVEAGSGSVRIHTPTTELPFAGHPLVGAAWLLERQGLAVETLRPPAGEVPTWSTPDGLRWIRGRAEWVPAMELRQHASPDDVDALVPDPAGPGFIDHWAWIDEAAGIVRSRVFARDVGIPEDEATGAAAVRLVTARDRPVVIRQGSGSVLHARPGPSGTAEVGGRVVVQEVREDVAR